ncbi:winged helix-turn-helix transcriptional regulator [Streptomyces sp. NPDC090075]|uniref:winged helix-turn-helix transcriptional regulator n=1 Tax=Streptomyces sp. NPDC090075 TaxID=3365937 RepID=UPI0037F1137E
MSDHTSRWRRRKPHDGKFRPDSPPLNKDRLLQGLHDVRHLLSGEWTWDVLVALIDKPLQYTRLLDTIRSFENDTGWPSRKHHHLQDSQLNRTLRRLEQGELVNRTREAKFPYHATYEISSAARALLTAASPLVLWADDYGDLLDRVRQRRREDVSD